MTMRVADLIFALTVCGPGGTFRQLAVTSDDEVYLTYKNDASAAPSSRLLDKRARDIGEFLWSVEGLGVVRWERSYGDGDPCGPDGWMMILDIRGTLHKWQGAGQYPPQWDRLTELVEAFLAGEGQSLKW